MHTNRLGCYYTNHRLSCYLLFAMMTDFTNTINNNTVLSSADCISTLIFKNKSAAAAQPTDTMTSKNKSAAIPKSPGLSSAEFKKKVQSLMKQIYELLTLCDVPGCLIIRNPNNSETYTWPESPDDVRRVLDLYASKLGGKSQKAIKLGGSRGADPIQQRLRRMSVDELKGMSVDELRSMPANEARRAVKVLDARIAALRKKIECAKTGTEGECGKVGKSQGFLSDHENDDNRKLLRNLRTVIEGLIEGGILGKRKHGSFTENGARESDGESMDEKIKRRSLAKIKKLLHELESEIETLASDTNHIQDGKYLTLGG